MIRQNKPSSSNKFHVLDEDEPSGSGLANRNKNLHAVKSDPPITGANTARRTPTPSKQITLQHVKRRDDDENYAGDEKFDLEEIKKSLSRENSEIFLTETKGESKNKDSKSSNKQQNSDTMTTKPPFFVGGSHGIKPYQSQGKPPPERSQKVKEESKTVVKKEDEKKPEEEESSDDSSSEEEEEKRKAPMELMMEFLECLMTKDYPNASKLCKMILIYEPDHAQALKFQPVIEERLQLDKEAEEESSESDSDDEDDDDDDDDDDDSGNSDEESDDDEDDGDENNAQGPGPSDDENKFDSGIVSANSDG